MDKTALPLAETLSIETPELFEAAVCRCTAVLKAGSLVALPTETVYGLAANALDAQAIGRIFEIKGRPSHNPIIAHVASLSMAKACVSSWQPIADRLASAFWPGPLTLVLPRAENIPGILTAGGPTVGIRWPSHPFIQAVIQRCGFPLAAPSANLSNRISPTSVKHVLKQLGDRVPLIVDGGQCQVGIESTVLDISGWPPRVLRPGMIHRQALLAVTGELAGKADHLGGPLRSPGLSKRHYAPRARLLIGSWNNDSELRKSIQEHGFKLSQTQVIAHTHIPSARDLGGVCVIPHDAEAYARAIYAQLHACDEAGASLIVVEAMPETDEWKALADRLNRAATA